MKIPNTDRDKPRQGEVYEYQNTQQKESVGWWLTLTIHLGLRIPCDSQLEKKWSQSILVLHVIRNSPENGTGKDTQRRYIPEEQASYQISSFTTILGTTTRDVKQSRSILDMPVALETGKTNNMFDEFINILTGDESSSIRGEFLTARHFGCT